MLFVLLKREDDNFNHCVCELGGDYRGQSKPGEPEHDWAVRARPTCQRVSGRELLLVLYTYRNERCVEVIRMWVIIEYRQLYPRGVI